MVLHLFNLVNCKGKNIKRDRKIIRTVDRYSIFKRIPAGRKNQQYVEIAAGSEITFNKGAKYVYTTNFREFSLPGL